MIIVRLMGGLGNQLFQYAAGLAVSLRTHQELAFDTEEYAHATHGDTARTIELPRVGVSIARASKKEIERLTGSGSGFV